MEKSTKCYALHLERETVGRLEVRAAAAGQTPTACLKAAVAETLDRKDFFTRGRALFLVTVRVDAARLADFGAALARGGLDRSRYLFTWCLKEDPAVGVSLWIADSREHLETLLEPHKAFYSEVIEIREVIDPAASLRMLTGG